MKRKQLGCAIAAAIAWEVESLEGRQYLANHAPVLDAIPNQTMPAGKTLLVPLTAADADGNPLTYSVTTTGGYITAGVTHPTDTWLQLSTTQGTMIFQLFDDITPNAVKNIVGLVNSGFYNGTQIDRVVVDNGVPFVVQGGDNAGDGSGNPGYSFNDEFNSNAIFDGNGQLAYSNGGKDDNQSQFFITSGHQRSLDFNYTLFGQLVRGFSTFKKYFALQLEAQSASNTEASKPVTPQFIKSATIIQDHADSVLELVAGTAGTSTPGSGTVTVKVDDGHGGTSTKTFTATATADTVNDPPYLSPIPDQTTAKNKTLSFNLTSPDTEGDSVEYAVQLADTLSGTASTSGQTVTFVPKKNFTGQVQLFVGVRAVGAQSRGNLQNPYDIATVEIGVGDRSASGTGATVHAAAGATTPGMVLATFTDSDPAGTAANWSVVPSKDSTTGNNIDGINWGDTTFTAGTVVQNADKTFSVIGSHAYPAPGTYPITITVEGNLGAQLILNATATVSDLGVVSAGILNINGSDGSDSIAIKSVGAAYQVNMNGKIRKFPKSGIAELQVLAMGGDDSVSIGTGVPKTYVDGGAGNDNLSGGDGNDTLTAGAGKNILSGNGGDDRLNGSGGRDSLLGGDGADRLYGNGGDDTLDGGGGVDRLFGGDNDDFLIGGASNDKLYGENGNDNLVGGKGSDIEDGGVGTDTAQQDGTDILTSIEKHVAV